MFEKEKIAIDITKESISIISGTKYKVTSAITIETPEDAFDEDSIIDVNLLASAIKGHVSKIRTKEAYFVLRGDDVISRQIELPIMKEEAMLDSVRWELSQFVGDRVDEYSLSYEIISSKNDHKAGNCKVLMVAVEKSKIAKYTELAKELKLKIVGIDIAANISSRVFKNLENIYARGVKAIGVIDISASYTSLSIIELGKLALDKFHSYGLKSGSNVPLYNKAEYENFLDKIDLEYIDEEDFTEGRLENYLDSITTQFSSFIQFYSSGKVKKNLDNIYIIGSGSKVLHIDEYFQNALNTTYKELPDFSDLKFSIKVNKRYKLKDYFYAYGMLLRNEKGDLNLFFKEEKKESAPIQAKKAMTILVSSVGILMALGIGIIFGGRFLLNMEKEKLNEEISKSEEYLKEEQAIIDKINIYKSHITFSSELEQFKSKDTSKYISELNNYFPSGVKATNITYSREKVVIIGTVSDYQLLEELWANLRESQEYKNCHIGSIVQTNNIYTFSLEILKEGVGESE